jgi:hypothetical protein
VIVAIIGFVLYRLRKFRNEGGGGAAGGERGKARHAAGRRP